MPLIYHRQSPKFARQREIDVLFADRAAFDIRIETIAQIFDSRFDDVLRRAGPGRDQHGPVSGKPLVAELVDTVDQMSRTAILPRNLRKPLAGLKAAAGIFKQDQI